MTSRALPVLTIGELLGILDADGQRFNHERVVSERMYRKPEVT